MTKYITSHFYLKGRCVIKLWIHLSCSIAIPRYTKKRLSWNFVGTSNNLDISFPTITALLLSLSAIYPINIIPLLLIKRNLETNFAGAQLRPIFSPTYSYLNVLHLSTLNSWRSRRLTKAFYCIRGTQNWLLSQETYLRPYVPHPCFDSAKYFQFFSSVIDFLDLLAI
jgi:hypothetical protein